MDNGLLVDLTADAAGGLVGRGNSPDQNSVWLFKPGFLANKKSPHALI